MDAGSDREPLMPVDAPYKVSGTQQFDLHLADQEHDYPKPLNEQVYKDRVDYAIYKISEYDQKEASRIAKARGLEIEGIVKKYSKR